MDIDIWKLGRSVCVMIFVYLKVYRNIRFIDKYGYGLYILLKNLNL